MKIHLIAIGGSIMHNLAISLQKAGHIVTGSDDEIYEPAKSRLANVNLLPEHMGWLSSRISNDIDLIILGMHAKADNPELRRALELEIKVMSFPEFIRNQSSDKQRVVIAGSHGKTTTTSMIMHVLKYHAFDFDYLVGAQLENFDLMVSLTNAPLIVIEGDEYLSSCLDRIPKIWHYNPHLTILTGVEWDHMNVFPSLKDYHNAFSGFIERLSPGALVFYDQSDEYLQTLPSLYPEIAFTGYGALEHEISDHVTTIKVDGVECTLSIFGHHNMKNLQAAYHVVSALGVTAEQFCEAIPSFKGASKRLQIRKQTDHHLFLQDFAHAPSKVRATVKAVMEQYPRRKLVACVELHTFSSLNKLFLPQYKNCLAGVDHPYVFYSPHTLAMKGMPSIDPKDIKEAFGRDDIIVMTDSTVLKKELESMQWFETNLLMMSSGTFGGLNYDSLQTISND